MSDEPTPAEETAADQAVARPKPPRRAAAGSIWARFVAVAGSDHRRGSALWNSWSERQRAAAERQAERAAESKEKAASSAVLLTATAEDAARCSR